MIHPYNSATTQGHGGLGEGVNGTHTEEEERQRERKKLWTRRKSLLYI